jgi:hypothetical protein
LLPFAANNLPGSLVVVVNDFVVVLVPGKGILVGVFAKVRVAFIDEGIFNGSTFMGGNVKGTGAGGTARLPGKVFKKKYDIRILVLYASSFPSLHYLSPFSSCYRYCPST